MWAVGFENLEQKYTDRNTVQIIVARLVANIIGSNQEINDSMIWVKNHPGWEGGGKMLTLKFKT